MKPRASLLLSLCCVLLHPLSAASEFELHLDPPGDDAAPGTAEAPLRTLGAAARAVG